LNVGDILCGNPQVYKDLVKVLVAPQVSTT